MKNCIECNHPHEDNAKFCNECGAKLPEAKANIPKGDYTASIGDKNVISGNIIGKNEEIKISGNATINKIEDDTKKTVVCSISGRRILMVDSIVCPSCSNDVAQDYYNQNNNRCNNCENNAHDIYKQEITKVFSDGIIDASERQGLDRLAISLMIDETKKSQIEAEYKQSRIQSSGNSTLSGFHKIEFGRALKTLHEDNNLEAGYNQLKNIYTKNATNDEIANLYYLVEAIYSPDTFLEHYLQKNVDIFWQHYWAFLPYLNKHQSNEAYEVIQNNKILFADKTNDVLICEVAFYLICFLNSNESEYKEEAKQLYASFGKNVKEPLIPFVKAIDFLVDPSKEIYARELDASENEVKFILDNVFGVKTNIENPIIQEYQEDGIVQDITKVKINSVANDIESSKSILYGDRFYAITDFNTKFYGQIFSFVKNNIYIIDSVDYVNDLVTFENVNKTAHTANKLWLPLENFKPISDLPFIDSNDINSGERVIWLSNKGADFADNYLIDNCTIYTIDKIKSHKNRITLVEIPPEGPNTKLHWFSIDCFRIFNINMQDTKIADNRNNNQISNEIISADNDQLKEINEELNKLLKYCRSDRKKFANSFNGHPLFKITTGIVDGKIDAQKKKEILAELTQSNTVK